MIMLAAAAIAQSVIAEPSIEQLGWLVGEWEFTDRSTPEAGFDLEETGTRTCKFAIDRKYIRCESLGTTAGKTRTYVFYFAHDPVDRRFEMVAMHGNWPRTILHTIAVSNAGRRLELLSEPYADGGKLKRVWGVATYDGSGKITWETGNVSEGSGHRGPVRFRDMAVRIRR